MNELVEIYKKRLLQNGVPKKEVEKDSHNSSFPPARDPLQKAPRTRSQREYTGRKPGGQRGHKGKTLDPMLNPHLIRVHPLNDCPDCHGSLKGVRASRIEKRQVFDLILPRLEVTEHQTERKYCKDCQSFKQSSFPAYVKADTQDGNRLKS